MNTYFAYGSNLNREDWHRWCSENGFSGNLIQPIQRVGRAYLPDYELKFSHYSASRGGGVLNVLPRVGQMVEGMLFEVPSEEGWAALDRKEGHPNGYRRSPVTILDTSGGLAESMTYIVDQASDVPFIPPAPGYAEIVRRGMQRLHLETKFLDAAAIDETIPRMTKSVFCYGTLMRGQCRFPQLAGEQIDRVVPATTLGRLVDLGDYPGMLRRKEVLAPRSDVMGGWLGSNETQPPAGAPLVAGELFELGDIESALRRLDVIEDFRGYGGSDSLYSRRLVGADSGEAPRQLAWAYFYEGEDGTPIPSGCWRTHKGASREDC